jgi:hypothetical protein
MRHPHVSRIPRHTGILVVSFSSQASINPPRDCSRSPRRPHPGSAVGDRLSAFLLSGPAILPARLPWPDARERGSTVPILPRCCSVSDPGNAVDYWGMPSPVACRNCVCLSVFCDHPFRRPAIPRAFGNQRGEFYQISAASHNAFSCLDLSLIGDTMDRPDARKTVFGG